MSRATHVSAATRRFWRITIVTAVGSAGSHLAQLATVIGDPTPRSVLPGLGSNLCAAISLAALTVAALTFPSGARSPAERVRSWLDAATIMVGAASVLWFTTAPRFLAHNPDAANVVAAIIVNAVTLVIFFALIKPVASAGPERPYTRRTGIFAITTVAIAIPGLLLQRVLMNSPQLRWVLVDRIFVAAFAIACVWILQFDVRLDVDALRRRPTRPYSRLPYAAVVIALGVVAVALAKNTVDGRTWGAFAGLAAVTTLVVIRQLAAFTDNARLVTELRSAVARADDLTGQLHYQAFHDSLTGLANRALFLQGLESKLTREADATGALAVMLVDLDDFKRVNDGLGHQFGDEVLRQTAERIRGCVDGGDTVARLGGDEFAVILDCRDSSAVQRAAREIVAAVGEPVVFGGAAGTVGASVGVVVVDSDSPSRVITDVLCDADLAMYAAKHDGKGRYAIFSAEMREREERRLALVDGLASGQILPHYQPIIDLSTGRWTAVEALARWLRPGIGLVPPGEFLGLAESAGLVPTLDRLVLRAACHTVAGWQAPAKLAVHVNVSATTLREDDFVEFVAASLHESGLPADALVMELTESTLVDDPRVAADRMSALRALGVRIAVDDFGTGYSSLAYLRDLPIDIVKIDKSFVDRLTGARPDTTLLRAIVGLLRDLGLESVAEGVETAEQAAQLRAVGCLSAQGYHFGRPCAEAGIALALDPAGELRRAG